jgi:hypothetical protein
MTDYLKRFIDRAADVPLQLRRRLALIRDLDEKAVALQREIDEHVRKRALESKGAAGRQEGWLRVPFSQLTTVHGPFAGNDPPLVSTQGLSPRGPRQRLQGHRRAAAKTGRRPLTWSQRSNNSSASLTKRWAGNC